MGIVSQAKDLAREQSIIHDMLVYLAEHGFHVSLVYDGENEASAVTPEEAVVILSDLEDGRIYFHEANAGSILIVFDYDMEPGESISDWTIPADGEFGHWMDQFTQEIYREDGKYHAS